MPVLEITSEHAPKDLDSFLTKLSAIFSEAIGKPESFCLVTFTKVDRLYFNGKTGNSFLAKVTSIGHIDNERNDNLTKVVSAELEKELGVSIDRGYFAFNDVSAENIGFKGTTFANLLKN